MANLLRLIGRRLVALPIVVVGVTILVFILTYLNPVDEAYNVLGDSASQQQIDEYKEEHGLNKPAVVRYFLYLGKLCQGDFGTFGANNASVADKIAQALPVTLQLTFCGLIIGIVFALILGITSAVYRDKWQDQLIRVFTIVAIAMPSFWLAVLLILVFSSNLHLFPASGVLPSLFEDPQRWFSRMILPSVALAVPLIGQMTRVIRTSIVEEFEKDYVRTALAAGIPRGIVIAKNVLRNALITPVTILGLRIGALLGGAVVIEVIFNLPGMGTAILTGIQSNFINLISGVALVVAFSFIIINIIVDMLYILIDPKIRSI